MHIQHNKYLPSDDKLGGKCTLWRCKSTPTRKAKLLQMTLHCGLGVETDTGKYRLLQVDTDSSSWARRRD